MPSSRRVLLAGLAAMSAAALTGCRPAGPDTPAQAAPAPPSPAPLPSPSAVPPPSGVTRADVVTRYGQAVPTSWGFDAPGVVNRLTTAAGRAIALTFDACGGPQGNDYDAALVGLLREHGAPATLFLNSRWIEANPQVFRQLAADPLFEIANHGTAHRPLSVTGLSAYGIDGTRDAGEVYDEIAGNRAGLTELLGHPPRFFRSGTAYLDDVAARIVTDLGERFAGFTVNGDGGATFTAEQVHQTVTAAGPGAIVLAHLNHPAAGTARGMATAIPRLLGDGYHFVRLSDGAP